MLHAFLRCTRFGWQPRFTHSISRSRRPPLIPIFAPHPHSHPIDLAAKRSQWSRIGQTVFRIRWLLKRGKAEEAIEIFQRGISNTPSKLMDPTPRFNLYDRGITTFLDYKHFKAALELHQQMSAEGMFAPCGLRAKMLICSSIVKAPHEHQQNLESLFDELSRVLSHPSYSQRSLCELLDVMKSHPLVNSQFVSKLVDKHVASRGPVYQLESNTINKLILFYAHIGNLDAAESVIVSHYQDQSPIRPRHANPGPYTTLISSLVKRGSLTSSRLNFLLDKMNQSQISIDLPFLNVLVQWAVRNENYHQAFALYETILRDNAAPMIPDSFVFGSLFNAHQRMLPRRTPSLRRPRLPPNAPMPRQLFRQMLQCQVLAVETADARTPPIVRVSTLNVALRLFMLSMDYPAAFVTLRTFYALGLRPDVRSYRFVITILFAHMRRSLRHIDEAPWSHASWAANFLGSSRSSAAQAIGVQPGEEEEDKKDIPPAVAHALLEFAVGGNAEYRTPTVPAILGEEEEAPDKAGWDVEPLERLVAKAILASLVQRGGVSRDQADRALREKMAPYFLEMVPEKLSIGRRLRRSRY